MGLESIIDVQIQAGLRQVSRRGFGVPLIIATGSADIVSKVEYYTSPEAAEAAGLTSNALSYVQAAFAQNNRPERVGVLKWSSADLLKKTYSLIFLPDVGAVTFRIALYNTTFDFTVQTDGELLADIVADAAAQVEAQFPTISATAGGPGELVIEGPDGEPFVVSVVTGTINITLVNAGFGLTELIKDARDFNDDWYMVLALGFSDAASLDAALYIESQLKMIGFPVTDEGAAVVTLNDDDLGFVLKERNLFRSFTVYYGNEDTLVLPAIAGEVLPLDPGSETWKFKNLRTVITSSLTSLQRQALEGKNINYYAEEGGVAIFREGVVASGEYIDVVRFRDWLQVRIQERIYSRLVNSNKIPFTDAGIGIIEAEVRAQLLEGIRVGGLAATPEPVVTVPRAVDVDPQDKQARLLRNVTFEATLAGAIHKLQIRGFISA